jgi:hypothetical protein
LFKLSDEHTAQTKFGVLLKRNEMYLLIDDSNFPDHRVTLNAPTMQRSTRIIIIVTVFCTRGTLTKECHCQPTNSGFLTDKAQGLPL